MPHKIGSCPKCHLGSYSRMSDREKRLHDFKHKLVADRRKPSILKKMGIKK